MLQEWKNFSKILRDVLDLEPHPVGISLFNSSSKIEGTKLRICKTILDAAKGESFKIGRENNLCLGAGWHLGFYKFNPKVEKIIKRFIVEGEKLFSDYKVLENLISQMEEFSYDPNRYFILFPLDKMDNKPQLVIFVCNPEQASRILTLSIFIDGKMPKIKIGGPTCRMVIAYPILTGELNLSFYDYTSRRMCNVEKDKLLISIPYKRISKIIDSLDRCSAGKAKLGYPQEFKDLLKKIRR
jgi:uncharacterized protein (DUF169 family)